MKSMAVNCNSENNNMMSSCYELCVQSTSSRKWAQPSFCLTNVLHEQRLMLRPHENIVCCQMRESVWSLKGNTGQRQ